MNYGRFGRCTATAKSTGKRCGRPAIGPHGKCGFHGGKSSGPKNTEYLEENDFARGNSGGGAPKLNTNAVQSGAWVDLEKLEARLSEKERDDVERTTEAYLKRATADLPEDELQAKAREIALLQILRFRATGDVFTRGFAWEEPTSVDVAGESYEYESTRVNPSVGRGLDLSARWRRLMSEIEAWP
ncbi:hypothetical protein C483_19520 [Natrialba hulunbeirensis JCM 10989]|nr:hypothetical protein [Haloferax volcanii]ELY86473.1 hypothetical protein C483_19520 [Natrialba hulunbeirensis JCM 10989]